MQQLFLSMIPLAYLTDRKPRRMACKLLKKLEIRSFLLMLPKHINPIVLLEDTFLKQLQSRFLGFPKIFDQLYRSVLGNTVTKNRNQPGEYLGPITSETPTVYSLLKKHPDYGQRSSTILDAHPNKSKAFNRIPTGSYVYMNPSTHEITWSMKPPSDGLKSSGQQDLNPLEPLSHRLDRAVKSYVGKPYEEIDCYELLVKGIKDVGFRYHGTGGIKDRLIQWAKTSGKKSNSYLTGEGLVQAAGNLYYTRILKPGGNRKAMVEEIYQDMVHRVNKGHILSFSTPTRGHTGIVSRRDGRWTFVNSGDMDHNLNGKQRSMAVGEEDLKAEIKNWLKRASRRNETLQISVGRLDGRKLAGYISPGRFVKRSV